jgi:hypothetical protein
MRQISRAQYLTKKMHEKDKEVKLDMQYLHEDMQHHRYAQQSHTWWFLLWKEQIDVTGHFLQLASAHCKVKKSMYCLRAWEY